MHLVQEFYTDHKRGHMSSAFIYRLCGIPAKGKMVFQQLVILFCSLLHINYICTLP